MSNIPRLTVFLVLGTYAIVCFCFDFLFSAALAVLSMTEVVHDNDQAHMGAMNMVQVRGAASGRCV